MSEDFSGWRPFIEIPRDLFNDAAVERILASAGVTIEASRVPEVTEKLQIAAIDLLTQWNLDRRRPPSALRDKLKEIERRAWALVEELGGKPPSLSVDVPPSVRAALEGAVFRYLHGAREGSLLIDEVTSKVAFLAAMAGRAAQTEQAKVDRRQERQAPRHAGDAVNVFITHLGQIWQGTLHRGRPTTSTRPITNEAGGPFLRFVGQALGELRQRLSQDQPVWDPELLTRLSSLKPQGIRGRVRRIFQWQDEGPPHQAAGSAPEKS